MIFLDKICDQVSDAVLDAHLAQDPDAKVACGMIFLNYTIFRICENSCIYHVTNVCLFYLLLS